MTEFLPFRQHHLVQLLAEYDGQTPLDLHIHHYFRTHKSLGSKDRAYIAEGVYTIVRWKLRIDSKLGRRATWEQRGRYWIDDGVPDARDDLPTHINVSCPLSLYTLLEQAYGDRAADIASENNHPAPTTIRANLIKVSRDALLQELSSRFDVSPCEKSEVGIHFAKRSNFFQLPEFTAGHFEVQDEGSQLIAALVQAKPGEQILDYCSGAGGKALAIAPHMQGKGQLYLHDIRKRALYEARKRLKRAGVQNAQLLFSDDAHLKKLKSKMDWVLVDAPCSGTGTLRRNPDMKWKFDVEMVTRLRGEQRTIFERALSFVKPGGHIVYATCSILPEENEQQMQHFLDTYPLTLVGEPFLSLPKRDQMDGFFGCVFQRKD